MCNTVGTGYDLADGRVTYISKNDDMGVMLEPIDMPDALAGRWLDLERRSDGSFFQSWAWIGCWLRHLHADLAPRLLAVSVGPEVVGLGVLVAHRKTRHGLLRARGLHLNETGDPCVDPLGLEYNGLLVDRRVSRADVACRCLSWLVERETGWDELNLGGLEAEVAELWGKAASEISLAVRVRAKERCGRVDLMDLRRKGGDYLGRLSSNTRQQIRRSMRLYETTGPLRLELAQTIEDAFGTLEDLKELHQAYWTKKGHPGAFARGFFEPFHRDLISTRFGAGEIQLLRISAGSRLIGCLYNFVRNGRIYAYQSGFDYDSDPRLKPGLVSHCLAIHHNLEQGARIYDFMAGDSRHKRSLGTDSHELTWLVVQRPYAGLQIENALRAIRWKFVGQTRNG